jgi:hypothetical protein
MEKGETPMKSQINHIGLSLALIGLLLMPFAALVPPANSWAVPVIDAVDESKSGDTTISELALLAANQAGLEYLTQKWKTGIGGTGIGASSLTAFDIDNDGMQEIVAGGGYGFDNNSFWYILSYSTKRGNYPQEWLSQEYSNTISRIVVADVTNSGQYAIYVALSNGVVQIYDATRRELLHTFSSPFGSIADIAIADVDNDSEQEIVTSSSSGIVVYDAGTLAKEWQTASYGSDDVEVANVDSDAAPEIVTTKYVIDGSSHALEWDYSADGFGAIVQLADIDNDNMAEIIAAQNWYRINAFDADTYSSKPWDIPTSHDIDALYVVDFDNDGVQEIVYGDGQWGAIHVIDSTTRVEEWHINNPEHGVTSIGFGDVDNDGVAEILWGAGWSSTGPDHLFIGNTTTHGIEWQSQDIVGPLSALDVGDVDNDDTNEIVMVSFESDSGYNDGMIFVYDAETYELEWRSDPILNGHARTGVHALELADVDNDNVLEILIATAYDSLIMADGLIMAYDGISHNLDWQTVKHDGTYFSALAVADIDNDGQLEVIGGQAREHTGATGVYVRVFDGSTGIEEWRTADLTYWGGVYDIDTGNFDEDENPEILFSVSDGNAYVYDGVTRGQEWQSSFANTRAVAGVDVDQDDDMEILIGTSSGQLYAFDGQTYVQEWVELLSSQSINSLRLADIDRDLAPELVLTDDSYLLVYDAATRNLVWQSEDLGGSAGDRGHLVIDDIDHNAHKEVVLGSDFAMYVFAPGMRQVYLPLVMRGYCGPDNYEPNDSCNQAYGPLTSGQTYQSWISCYDLATYKKSDYFYINISTTNAINIYLTDIPAGTDYDLYLYRYPGDDPDNPAAKSVGTGSSESISYAPPAAGRYYIRVYSYSGFSTSPYSLRVTYD